MNNRQQWLHNDEYEELVRKATATFTDRARMKQPRIKEGIVHAKGYKNLRLEHEDVAEFPHRPGASRTTYRMIVLRKTLVEERGQRILGAYHRYFFYITNDETMPADEVVRESNARCNQENLLSQLKTGVRALRAPLNTLESNWAYMVIASLAWTLKAWLAMLLPIAPRWADHHRADREPEWTEATKWPESTEVYGVRFGTE